MCAKMLSVSRLMSLSTFEVSHANENTCGSVPDNFMSLVRCLVVTLATACSGYYQMGPLPLVNPNVGCPLEDASRTQFQRMEEGNFENDLV